MGEADRYREFKKAKPRFRLGQENNALAGLFVLNTVFFLILFTVKVVYEYYQVGAAQFQTDVLQWFQLSSRAETFSERPWTIISYVFSDSSGEIFRLLSNMLWLWAFGYQLQQMAGNDKLIPVYLYGGVGGGVFFLVASTIGTTLHSQSGLLGANTGVLAVAAAATTVDPQFRILTHIRKGIPIWVLTAIYFLIDLAAIGQLPAAYKWAHFGAALTGFLFVILLRKGWDGSVWMNNFYSWVSNLFNPNKKRNPEKNKPRLFYNPGNRTPYTKTPHVTQERIDEILDKINSKGYHFLTEEEKNILKKAAEDGQ